MPGLLTRIRRRRPSAPTTAPAAHASEPESETPQPVTAAAPLHPFERPGFQARGQLRRRLRHLRHMRELGLRDIGGLVFDLDRFGRSRDDLVREKLAALAALDTELAAITTALDEDASFDELREVGIAACPSCGALLSSDSRFCSACGVHVGRGEAAIATAFASGAALDGGRTPSGLDAAT